MIHFIQDNIFQDVHYNLLIDTVKKFELEHQIITFVPKKKDSDEINTDLIFEPIESNNVFCWGSVKLANYANKYGWNPGSLYNSNHDYRVYSKFYKENMLNWDSQILKFGDKFQEPGYLFHARPCEDTKSFTGQVFTKASWDDYAKRMLELNSYRLDKDTIIQVSKLKTIYQEVRFFIVGGKIITASQYRLNDRTIYQECMSPNLHDFVNDMIKIYQPAEAFVMDIAVVPDGLKIVEINCINCSGFYAINMQKLVGAVDDFFTK